MPDIDDNDKSEFLKAMQDVIPLKKSSSQKKLTNLNVRQKAVINNKNKILEQGSNAAYNFHWRTKEGLYKINPNDQVEFFHAGVNKKQITQPSKQLDLHGCSLDEAAILVENTINTCYKQNLRQIKLITGKGSGTIKSAVICWLEHHPKILGFKTAPSQDGGTGCLYILIKRRKL